ncbi:MAG: VOC family protein [Caldilineaceae bacterium]|nr:VOC family protein [Caldilineaceae bacterium]
MPAPNMTLRLELFVADIAASRDFYTRVLNFAADDQHGDGYTPLRQGSVILSLNRRAFLPEDHPIFVAEHERPGRGIEIVLEVDDVKARHAHVESQNWPVTPLQRQPWGLVDFRLVDPDGYYLRVTSRTASM